MNEKYDAIVLGTGLKECILSSLLSKSGKKVLQIDRNDFYGGDISSITPLEAVFTKFDDLKNASKYSNGKEWYIDLVSKFLMADGKMVQLLLRTGVTRYMNFRNIDGSYIYKSGEIHKVPANESEAVSTNLMDLFMKRRFRKFLIWVTMVDKDNQSTWCSVYPPPMDITKDSIVKAFEHFNIDEDTQDFIGDVICQFQDASYKRDVPCIEIIRKIQLYNQSVNRFGKSPFIYPLYGIGELSQGFARFSAVHGAVFMLKTPVDELLFENGTVVGIKSGSEVAHCDLVVCDPSFAPDRIEKRGQLVRAICILKHPINGVNNTSSCQIIIPHHQLNRKHDIYVSCVSNTHKICPKDFYVAYVTSIAETASPKDELKPGIDLLEPIEHVFYSVDDFLVPTDDGSRSKVFVTSSYDASPNFESTYGDVVSLYERITGNPFDISQFQTIADEE